MSEQGEKQGVLTRFATKVKEGIQTLSRLMGGEAAPEETPSQYFNRFILAASSYDKRGQLDDALAWLKYELLQLQLQLCEQKEAMRQEARWRLST